VLAIFGPTDPLRTGPYGSKHRVIAGKLKCQPCFVGKCRFQDEACLRAVTPKMVVAAAMEMLLGQNVRPVA
jgi:ADP-heptose:LPS heptosyltransferase